MKQQLSVILVLALVFILLVPTHAFAGASPERPTGGGGIYEPETKKDETNVIKVIDKDGNVVEMADAADIASLKNFDNLTGEQKEIIEKALEAASSAESTEVLDVLIVTLKDEYAGITELGEGIEITIPVNGIRLWDTLVVTVNGSTLPDDKVKAGTDQVTVQLYEEGVVTVSRVVGTKIIDTESVVEEVADCINVYDITAAGELYAEEKEIFLNAYEVSRNQTDYAVIDFFWFKMKDDYKYVMGEETDTGVTTDLGAREESWKGLEPETPVGIELDFGIAKLREGDEVFVLFNGEPVNHEDIDVHEGYVTVRLYEEGAVTVMVNPEVLN